MPVTTVSAAVHITPVVIRTFFKHGKKKAEKYNAGTDGQDAKDDVFFDEAFHIVKSFIELGTKNTVESLQGFTNTHVPSPFWAAVSPVQIPLSSCNKAADTLIDWFGPDELKRVVGGSRWWQVRGLDGVDGEWITEKEYLSDAPKPRDAPKDLSDEDHNIIRMEGLDTVMLYVHGGGYFWGSINTHRYQIIRYSRKIKGRAFAVNYRKAPQYPWPCPIQDVIAAYFYLTSPPPEALHKPIPAEKIVLAGDSAGAGLCVSVLTVLRDMGLPMPAGAVLISPWVDLTHSFPSVMQNTETDIIPQHGFLAKPSTLWPVDLIPRDGGRVIPTSSNPPPKPGHADTLNPENERVEDDLKNGEGQSSPVKSQESMLADSKDSSGSKGNSTRPTDDSDSQHKEEEDTKTQEEEDVKTDRWEPKPPKVLMKDPQAVPLELRSQIQLYATTEQLSHPLVSPVLQGSLGNLPPLYIIAGNDEVLRDEIVYLAHRAAHPAEYPTRTGVLKDAKRQKENAEKWTQPTRVHLQVFDDMPHVLTVFSFTDSAKYAYRAIAEFVKHVSTHTADHLERNPFPELHRPISQLSDEDPDYENRKKEHKKRTTAKDKIKKKRPEPVSEASGSSDSSDVSDVRMYMENEEAVGEQVERDEVDKLSKSSTRAASDKGISPTDLQAPVDVPNVSMIRERVDIHGQVRKMEPKDEVPALQMRPAEVGLIKEEPTIRWLKGQEEWDRRYKADAKRAIKQRKRIEAKSRRILDNAKRDGLGASDNGGHQDRAASIRSESSIKTTKGMIQVDRRWGPLDLEDENPPPTAICKRLDTPEAYVLLKKHIYHTAPVTHNIVPKQKTADAIRAAFDPHDDPLKPPRQSVSEQQVKTHVIPVHGVRMWEMISRYFMRKSATKALRGKQHATNAMKNAGEQLGVISNDSK